MKNKLLKLAYIRKRERTSLLSVICILLLSSFSDEIFISIQSPRNLESKPETEQIAAIEMPAAQPSLSLTQISENIENSENIAYSKSTDTISLQDSSGLLIKKLPTKISKPLVVQKINPNEPDIDHLISLGVSSKVAYTWQKYTQAGGKIHNKEELSKVYGMTDELIDKIDQYIIFPQKLKFNKKAKLVSVYINQATAYEFSKISGIGPTLSERIVKFRDKLGGFHSLSQLKEVYGIDAEIIDKNANSFLIEQAVQKININTCDEEQLGLHSYCSYRVAKAIINYRKQHGNFTGPEDLKKLRIVDGEWIDKISPYLEY
jgi:competence ComEA-like helix-hairpin-helix protein